MKKLTNTQIRSIINTGATKKDGSFKFDTGYFVDQLIAGEKVYTTRTTGSGTRTKYSDAAGAHLASKVLNAAGYTVNKKNDSPRGGQLGEHYVLTRAVKASAAEIEAQIVECIKQENK